MDKQQNTQQPVAWLVERHAFRASQHGQDAEGHDWLEVTNDGEAEAFPVFTAPPVPRDVLMAFGEDVSDACAECAEGTRLTVDIAAIADRYASQVQPVAITDDAILAIGKPYCKDVCHIPVYSFNEREFLAIARRIAAATQPEPVNQQTLAALKALADMDVAYQRGAKVEQAVEAARAAIAAAEAAQPVGCDTDNAQSVEQELFVHEDGCAAMPPDSPLQDGSKPFCRFARYHDGGDASVGIPSRTYWALTDNQAGTELADILAANAQHPASAQPVAVPDGYVVAPVKPTHAMLDAAVIAGDEPGSDYYTIYSAMLSAAQKPEGGE